MTFEERVELLEKKVADLEGQVQSQQKTIVKLHFTDCDSYNIVIKNRDKRNVKSVCARF